jgi:hypothetical protein
MGRELNYMRELVDQLNALRYEFRLNPLNLGGTSGSEGGSTGTPGGVIGQLSQRDVSGDYTESSFLITSGSIGSLVDNLSRMRYWMLPGRQFGLESHSPETNTWYVSSGSWYFADSVNPLIFTGGETPVLSVPSSGSRFDLLTISTSGLLQWTSGAEGASPTLPTLPGVTSGSMPLWLVLRRSSGSACFNTDDGVNHYIFRDERPFLTWGLGGAGGTSGSYPQRFGGLASAYQSLPMLHGAWLMSSVDTNGNVIDFSGQGQTLTNNGSAPYTIINNAVNVASLSGGSYFSRATDAALEITGGLTFTGWFYLNALDDYFFMSKSEQSPNLGYRIWTYLNQVNFGVSNDGSGETSVTSTGTLSANTWYMITVRYDPSNEIAVFINGAKDTNTTSIPASLFVGVDPFIIGSTASYGVAYNGYIGACGLCAVALPDALILDLYNLTRVGYGV